LYLVAQGAGADIKLFDALSYVVAELPQVTFGGGKCAEPGVQQPATLTEKVLQSHRLRVKLLYFHQ
jgi:hypothetical protein